MISSSINVYDLYQEPSSNLVIKRMPPEESCKKCIMRITDVQTCQDSLISLWCMHANKTMHINAGLW